MSLKLKAKVESQGVRGLIVLCFQLTAFSLQLPLSKFLRQLQTSNFEQPETKNSKLET